MSQRKTILLYKSKYGSTRKYVEMLKTKLPCEAVDLDAQRVPDLAPYDAVVLAGALYASGIAGIGVLRKHYAQIADKKLAILCVGASPYEEQAFLQMKARNLKQDLKHIPVFYARGAWDEDKMTLKDKILCKMLEKHVKSRDPATYEPWMKAFAEAMGQQRDWVDEGYLQPLIDYLKES